MKESRPQSTDTTPTRARLHFSARNPAASRLRGGHPQQHSFPSPSRLRTMRSGCERRWMSSHGCTPARGRLRVPASQAPAAFVTQRQQCSCVLTLSPPSARLQAALGPDPGHTDGTCEFQMPEVTAGRQSSLYVYSHIHKLR